MIIDVFPFFNELDILEARLEIMYDHVDFFIITEFDETFKGKPKGFIFLENQDRFTRFNKKIVYNQITANELHEICADPVLKDYLTNFAETKSKFNNLAAKSLHPSCRREIKQRDSMIKRVLDVSTSEEDVILLSDVDEILSGKDIQNLIKRLKFCRVVYAKMQWFMYSLKHRRRDGWIGGYATRVKHLKNSSLDSLRIGASEYHSNSKDVLSIDAGWHLSYFGNSEFIKEKINALAYQGIRARIASLLVSLGLRSYDRCRFEGIDPLLRGRKLEQVTSEDFSTDCNDIAKVDWFYLKYYRDSE